MDNTQALARGLALFQKARDLQAGGQLATAAEHFRQALLLLPEHPPLLLEYARLAEQAGDWRAMEQLLRQLGKLRPASGFEGSLALALIRQSRHEEAIPFLQAHLRKRPTDHGSWLTLASIHYGRQAWAEALDCAQRSDALQPGEKAMEIVLNCLTQLGRADELDRLVPQALQRHPDSRSIRSRGGLHLLKRWKIASGMCFQQDIRALYDAPGAEDAAIASRPWDGHPFDGVLLVSAEQGLGEQILASRFFRPLAASGQRAIVECDARLLPIFRRSFPELEFRPRWEGHLDSQEATGIPCRRIRALDLVRFFCPRDDLPPAAPWLQADNARVEALRSEYAARWPGKRLVALSWRSSREHNGEHWKSAPLTSLAPLLTMPDTVMLDVQYGQFPEDHAAAKAAGLPLPVRDDRIDARDDLDGLLAQLCAVDMLVSVSNSTVHLAGAAGIRGEVLLPRRQPVFWYWGYAEERTPWYPSLRLWRPGTDDWQALATRIAETLAREMRTP